jgi:hypothetical protein
MFSRDNLVGIVLLGLCGVSATALLIVIFTDYSFQYSGPQWLARVIALGSTALVLVMMFSALKRRFGRHGGPTAPRGGPSWPENDLPRSVNWPGSTRSNGNPASSTQPPASDPVSKPDTEEKAPNGPG